MNIRYPIYEGVYRILTNERMYAPFKYAVNAYCLDNIQTFDRRYVTLEDALLHCLNGFNENANIPNRYKSIGHYLSGKS